MALRPICEPVELPPGVSVIAEHVAIEPGGGDVGRFPHFHDVAEMVLFRKVSGSFIADGRRHPLDNGAIIFVPSMRHHDFELEGGAMDWVLVQMDPYLVEALAQRVIRLSRPFCVNPGDISRRRIEVLADWLVDAVRQRDSTVERIVELLLLAAAQVQENQSAFDNSETMGVERLLPALELLRIAPQEPFSHETAATACNLSSAYFSRRFRQSFGMTFSDYSRIYRLHLAARRLISSGSSISEISYGVGFSSPSHFSARFRERFGMTPRTYRASARARATGERRKKT